MSWRNPTFVALLLIAAVSARAENGTRVSIRLPEGQALPDAQKIVEALEAAGGEHQVLATVHKGDGQQDLTLDLWGNYLPSSQIPQTLRDGFPALSAAEIEISSLEANARPKLDADDLDGPPANKDGKKIVKKIIRQHKS